MIIVYSMHAVKRMKQRGITPLDVEHVLTYPFYIKKSFDRREEAFGSARNKEIMVKFIRTENYIRIITVI